MEKDRILCKAKDCMIRTCSRHPCHRPKWYNKPIIWIDFVKEGCDMYISRNRPMDAYKDYYEDDEDDDIL